MGDAMFEVEPVPVVGAPWPWSLPDEWWLSTTPRCLRLAHGWNFCDREPGHDGPHATIQVRDNGGGWVAHVRATWRSPEPGGSQHG